MMSNLPTTNNFQNAVLVSAEAERSAAQVQAQMLVAARFPRNPIAVRDEVELECGNFRLAEKSQYSFSRGGQTVSGPSIRLAEMLASCYGHIDYGVKMIEQTSTYAVGLAVARDLQKNVGAQQEFKVQFSRFVTDKRTGQKISKPIEDPRDQSEHFNAQASKAVRGCILRIIPSHLVDLALEVCDQTLSKKYKIDADTIKSILDKFLRFGVTKTQIERRIQKRIESIDTSNVIQLSKIFNSLEAGMSTPEDWFAAEETREEGPKISKLAAKAEAHKAQNNSVATEAVSEETGEVLPSAQGEEQDKDSKLEAQKKFQESLNRKASPYYKD